MAYERGGGLGAHCGSRWRGVKKLAVYQHCGVITSHDMIRYHDMRSTPALPDLLLGLAPTELQNLFDQHNISLIELHITLVIVEMMLNITLRNRLHLSPGGFNQLWSLWHVVRDDHAYFGSIIHVLIRNESHERLVHTALRMLNHDYRLLVWNISYLLQLWGRGGGYSGYLGTRDL